MSDTQEGKPKPDSTLASVEIAKRGRVGVECLALSLAAVMIPAVANAGETIKTTTMPHVTVQPKTPQKNSSSNTLTAGQLKGISGASGKTRGHEQWVQ